MMEKVKEIRRIVNEKGDFTNVERERRRMNDERESCGVC